MAKELSFDLDLPTIYATGGALGSAVAILRSCFGWRGASPAGPDELLVELQQPATQALVEWNQDVVLAVPIPIGDRDLIATENQSCWQASRRPDGVIELGESVLHAWRRWADIDLADLLFRLLVSEAVVGHGPFLYSPPLPREAIVRYDLAPPVEFADGDAGLLGVVATARWFGVTSSRGDQRWVCAAPVDRARSDLVGLAPQAFWCEVP